MSASAPVRSNSEPGKAYLGYFYIALAAFLWGISASLGRAAFTERLLPGSGIKDVNPLILSQARTTFSFFAVFVVLVARRGWKSLSLPRRDLLQVFVLGLAGVAASNYFYYFAIQRTNVATAIIVQYTAPVWVLLYTIARKAERPTFSNMFSVILAIAGIGLVIGILGPGRLQLDKLGVAAALIAAFAFAFYNIAGHSLLAKYDRWIVLMFTTLSASAFWIVVNPPNRIAASHYSAVVWVFLLVFSLLSVLLPFSFYFAGLQHLKPTKAIVASCLEPVFTVLIAAVALREVLRPVQAVGMGMVLFAIVVAQISTRAESEPPVGPVD
jgi:drug/metabolite transporter (DMT)-like permease